LCCTKPENPTARLGVFDVITSSNVADHIGLSTLLIACRPLLKDGGLLFTTTFLSKSNHGSTKQFLQQSLLDIKPEDWTTAFGFRALGHEVDRLVSPACQVAHSDLDHQSYGISSRMDSTMVWIATRRSNVLLELKSSISEALKSFDPSLALTVNAHNSSGKVVALCSQLFEYGMPPSGKINPEQNILSSLISKYSPHLSEEHPRLLVDSYPVLCSFPIGNDNLRSSFCTAVTKTPVIIATINGKRVSGLWYEPGDEVTRFFFLVSLSLPLSGTPFRMRQSYASK
jgi:hypothetical protein